MNIPCTQQVCSVAGVDYEGRQGHWRRIDTCLVCLQSSSDIVFETSVFFPCMMLYYMVFPQVVILYYITLPYVGSMRTSLQADGECEHHFQDISPVRGRTDALKARPRLDE